MFNFLKQKNNKPMQVKDKFYVNIVYVKYNIWLSKPETEKILYGFELRDKEFIAHNKPMFVPMEAIQYIAKFLNEIIKLIDKDKVLAYSDRIHIWIEEKEYSYVISKFYII
ncbi:MAG: hypothetical protein QXS19_06685 [Candidatus Methanomethylicia archaeon]